MQCGLATMGNSLIILHQARCTHISYTSNSTPRNLFQQNKNLPPNEISHTSLYRFIYNFQKTRSNPYVHQWQMETQGGVSCVGTVGRRRREPSIVSQWQILKLLRKVKETRHNNLPPLLYGAPDMAKLHGAKQFIGSLGSG